MTETAAPAPAHFVKLAALRPVSCLARNHGPRCRQMVRGKCSGCGTEVVWYGGRMIGVGHELGGRARVGCWWATHQCPAFDGDIAEQIWCEANPDLAQRNTVRVMIEANAQVREQIVAAGADPAGIDAHTAALHAMLDDHPVVVTAELPA